MAAILIIDGRASRRRFLARAMQRNDHEIRMANGAAQAIAMIRARPPDLVLVDVLMPRAGGYRFLRRLRSEASAPAPRVVLLGAPFMVGEARELARACGVEHLVADIADTEDLLAVVESALASPAPSSPLPAADAASHLLYPVVRRLYGRVTELEKFNARLERRAAASAARIETVRFALDREVLKRLLAEQDNRRLRAKKPLAAYP